MNKIIPSPVSGSGDDPRPLSVAWVTDGLLVRTREVWSEAYGRIISEAEAIEILVNVKRLGEVMLRAVQGEGDADERRIMGKGLVPRAERGLLDRRPAAGHEG